MAIDVQCPKCSKKHKAREEQLGRSARCVACGTPFVLQATTATQEVAAAAYQTVTQVVTPSAATAPARLGRFKLGKPLGKGTFGTVYRAHDELLGREVALKVPHPGALQSEKDRARYLREPKAAAQLHHPHIVPLFDAGFDGEQFFIASAFIAGQTLERTIEGQRLDLKTAATLVSKLAGALHYAHGQGIVHRDVKPANVMLDEKGEPHLMDFGLAQVRQAEEKLTHDGTLLGTPAYMSPEQAGNKAALVGPASDQYSLGVVLYELLCGERPFSGPVPLVISLHVTQEPTSPRERNAAVPRDLETICLKALAKDPAQRYADCAALENDLRRWLGGDPVSARPILLVERVARWIRRSPALAIASFSAIALVVLVAVISTVSLAIVARLSSKERAARVLSDKNAAEAAANAQKAIDNLAQANENAGLAAQNETLANKNAAEAQANAQAAQAAASDAVNANKATTAALQRANEEKLAARRLWYGADMLLAQAAYDAGQIARARELLDGLRPEDDELDLRGFDWHYLSNRVGGNRSKKSFDVSENTYTLPTPDGAKLLGATKQGWCALNLTTGKQTPYRSAVVRPLAISASGRLMVGTSEAGLELFDLETITHLRTLTVDKPNVAEMPNWTAACFEGESHVWVGSERGSLKRISVGFNIVSPPVFTGGARMLSLDISADGRFLAAGFNSHDDRRTSVVAFYKLPAMDLLRKLPIDASGVWCIRSNPKGDLFATATHDGIVRVWDAESGKVHHELRGHTDDVVALAFSADGTQLASAGHDRTVRVWDVELGRELRAFVGHTATVDGVHFRPSGELISWSHGDKTVKSWESSHVHSDLILTSPYEKFAPHEGSILFSADSTRLITIADQKIFAWNLGDARPTVSQGKELKEIFARAQDSTIHSLEEGGKCLLMRDPETLGEISRITWPARNGGYSRVYTSAMSADNERLALAIGGAQGPDDIRVIDVAQGEELSTCRGHRLKGGINLELSQDGKYLVSHARSSQMPRDGGDWCSHELFLWDATEGKVVHKILDQAIVRRRDYDHTNVISLSSDGSTLAYAHEGKVIWWDVASRQPRGSTPIGSEELARCLAFSADGSLLAVSMLQIQRHNEPRDPENRFNGKSQIKLLDSVTLRERMTIPLPGRASRLAFSPDGRVLAACVHSQISNDKGAIHVWLAKDFPQHQTAK